MSYTAPVDRLLTYGTVTSIFPDDWLNYLEEGFGLEHVPELIRMATDEELNNADSESLEVWAPVHAWRTLGQLRAEAAIEPLLIFLEETKEENDWVLEELPDVLGMIGPAALPALAARLAGLSYDEELREIATECIEKIGTRWPEVRPTCVEILTSQLELFAEQDPELNASLIWSLMKLDAREVAPLMQRAFTSGSVDTSLMGDWDDVQVEFDLLSAEELKQRRSRVLPNFAFPSPTRKAIEPQASARGGRSRAGGQKKVKQKMAKQSRKKNRKR